MRTAAEGADAQFKDTPQSMPAALKAQSEQWRRTAQRYESEPETNEGRKELAERAKAAEAKRDRSLAAYHHYEVASAAVQIAIVLASAAIITGAMALMWIGVALGAVGVLFCGIGFFAPAAVHLF
jgi:hypothetical protein